MSNANDTHTLVIVTVRVVVVVTLLGTTVFVLETVTFAQIILHQLIAVAASGFPCTTV